MKADRRPLREARERLDGWTYTARDRAYRELFVGDDAAVAAEEQQFLGEVDAEFTGDGDDGFWGTDEYVVVMGHPKDHPIPIVYTRHPEIPPSWSWGGESLTEPECEQFNNPLRDYCERVRRYVQDEVDEFVDVAGVPKEQLASRRSTPSVETVPGAATPRVRPDSDGVRTGLALKPVETLPVDHERY